MSLFIETNRIIDCKAFNIDLHNQRLNSTRLHFFGKIDEINIDNIIDPSPYKELTKCRITYNKEIVSIEYIPYQARPVSSLKLVKDNTIDYSWKTTNRETINRLFASRQKYDDILIVKNDLITDTSICNVAFSDGNRWKTPEKPLLKGTQREYLLRRGTIQEARISADDISKYKHISLFNAMIGFGEIILPVTSINI